MSKKVKVRVGGQGIGLAGATFLVLMTLKLTGHIDWSWLWVTAPLWGGFAILIGAFAAIAVVFGIVALTATGIDSVQRRRRKRRRQK